MTTVYLCRHGETESVRADRYYSRESSSLTATGVSQTGCLARRFERELVSAVYASQSDRSTTAADQIARRHCIPFDIVPEFVEWHPGEWTGLTRSEVQSRYTGDYEAWLTDPAAKRPLNGESLYDVAARSVPRFVEIVESHDNECIVVVGHNTVNRVLLAHLLCIPLRVARNLIMQGTGCVNTITRQDREGWRVISVNESPEETAATHPGYVIGTVAPSPAEFLRRIDSVQRRLKGIWPEGRNPCPSNDGMHWTLPPFDRPVSVGRVESYFLYNLAALVAPAITIEVGTGFGYSTLWLAGGAAVRRPCSILYSIDNRSEGGLGYEGLKFARAAARDVGIGNAIRLVHGESPDVLLWLPIARVDLAFIDGNHRDAQPQRDFAGVAALMEASGVVIWHDVDPRYTVPEAFDRALAEGWHGQVFETSCRIGVTYRDPTSKALVAKAFEAARALRLVTPSVI
jgi:broad specificity phosphatase PhoE/predicted O-methyltransferase YrrM